MTDQKNFHEETICVQGGYTPQNGEPRIVPIVQSTTYKYDNTQEVADLFDLKTTGHFYTRLSNPTVEVLEKKIAELEGGVAALATASGQTATLFSILNIASSGDHIVALNNLYGGTVTLLASRLKQFGIETTFVSAEDSNEEIASKIKSNTKLIFGETLSNPDVRVLDIERFAEIAHDNGIPLIVDNTFATPVLVKPIEHGADIVTYSATKYLDGHATSVGGLIVDSGKFHWTEEKFSCLTDKDPDYHGLSYTESFKEQAYIVKARVGLMRDIGAVLSPMNAFLINLGMETLHLRMERHSENTLKIAKFLEDHPKISWVHYPLLESDPDYPLAQKYLKRGASGVLSFGIEGGRDAGEKFIDSVKLASLVVHVGDLRTHVLHPASSTHRQLSNEDLKNAGIGEDTIRLSVGIENVEDLIADLDQALKG